MNTFNTLLDYTLLYYDTFSLRIGDLFVLLFLFLAGWVASRVIKRLIYKSDRIESGKKYNLFQLFRYFIIFFILLFSVQSLGINLSVILAGSAALLVGIGLGLQNLFNDFTSGVLLLIDGSVKVGDILEVEGKVYEVKEIRFRTTVVVGRDENYVILPNSHLTRNPVANWTYDNHRACRFKVEVGVAYGSPVDLVKTILENTAAANPKILKEPLPFVRFEDFGDSQLTFSVFFWSTDSFRVENLKSDLRFEINRAFNDQGITIPFPQRTLHFANSSEISD
jgi:small-conductance mechanosensitive channel